MVKDAISGKHYKEGKAEKKTAEEVRSLIEKVKKFVTWAKHTSNVQTKLEIATGKKLIQCGPTRWNSEADMIERFLLVKGAFEEVLQAHQNHLELPTLNEYWILADIMEILKEIRVRE